MKRKRVRGSLAFGILSLALILGVFIVAEGCLGNSDSVQHVLVQNVNHNNITVFVPNDTQGSPSLGNQAVAGQPGAAGKSDAASAVSGSTTKPESNPAASTQVIDGVIYAPMVDYKVLATDYLNSGEGALASDHCMRGRLHYPIAIAYPEEGLLQIRFSDVTDNGDGSYLIKGKIPIYDEKKLNYIDMKAVAVDENGKRTGRGSVSSSGGNDFSMNVQKYQMEGEPQEIVFDVALHRK